MKTKSKKIAATKRDKRKLRIRNKVNGSNERPRLSVFRSTKHIYAQLISDVTAKTLVSASTLDEDVQGELKKMVKSEEAASKKGTNKSVLAARAVGVVLGQKAKVSKIEKAVFDRNGFLYAGRIQALADGAREAGLDF